MKPEGLPSQGDGAKLGGAERSKPGGEHRAWGSERWPCRGDEALALSNEGRNLAARFVTRTGITTPKYMQIKDFLAVRQPEEISRAAARCPSFPNRPVLYFQCQQGCRVVAWHGGNTAPLMWRALGQRAMHGPGGWLLPQLGYFCLGAAVPLTYEVSKVKARDDLWDTKRRARL